jgi:hypothetical protein
MTGFDLFIWLFCSSFNDAVGNKNCRASNDWAIVSNELRRVWKERVVA